MINYLKNVECSGCLKMRPLVIAVRFHVCYGGPRGETLRLCASCRLNSRADSPADMCELFDLDFYRALVRAHNGQSNPTTREWLAVNGVRLDVRRNSVVAY